MYKLSVFSSVLNSNMNYTANTLIHLVSDVVSSFLCVFQHFGIFQQAHPRAVSNMVPCTVDHPHDAADLPRCDGKGDQYEGVVDPTG